MYNFRTDLANERADLYKKANKIDSEISGIESEEIRDGEEIITTRVKIINENGENAIGKPIGTYITIDVKNLRIAQDEEIRQSSRSSCKGIKRDT